MKTIYVLRHGKAKDGSLFGSDKDRKLNNTGKEQVQAVAKKFFEKQKTKMDCIITSDATRTEMTTNIVATEIGCNNIVTAPTLYNAPMEVYYKVITQQPDAYNSILIVAHNPGITNFVNSLNIIKLDNMPTSCLVGFTSDCTSWLNFIDANNAFLYIDYPNYS
jgi:phosphohistidine phosphatase